VVVTQTTGVYFLCAANTIAGYILLRVDPTLGENLRSRVCQ